MNHKKCGGDLVIDCTSMYIIRSPSIKVTLKGIVPGIMQIDNSKIKESPKLVCKDCGKVFATKEDFEEGVEENCPICGQNRKPSEIKFSDYTGYLCVHCIKTLSDAKFNPSKSTDKLLLLYGEVLGKVDSPTLLTILMKK